MSSRKLFVILLSVVFMVGAFYGRDDLVKLLADSGRTGFSFRVLKEGIVEKGARLLLKEKDLRRITISFASHTFHHHRKNCVAISRNIEKPLLLVKRVRYH